MQRPARVQLRIYTLRAAQSTPRAATRLHAATPVAVHCTCAALCTPPLHTPVAPTAVHPHPCTPPSCFVPCPTAAPAPSSRNTRWPPCKGPLCTLCPVQGVCTRVCPAPPNRPCCCLQLSGLTKGAGAGGGCRWVGSTHIPPPHTDTPTLPTLPTPRCPHAHRSLPSVGATHAKPGGLLTGATSTPPFPGLGGGRVSHFPTGGNRIPGSRAPTGCNAKGRGPVVPVPPWVLGPAHAPEPGQPWGRFRYNRGATEGTAARSEPPRLQLSTALSGMVLGTGEGKARRPAWVLGEARGGRSPTSPQMWQLKWGSRQAAKFSRRQ